MRLLVVLLVVASAACVAADLVVTPFGYWPSECVHAAPGGAHVHNFDDSFHIVSESGRKEVTRCSPDLLEAARSRSRRAMDEGDGWQQYTHQNVGNVTALLGSWNVPKTPQEEAQVLFMFTGLQNIDWVPPQPQPSQPFDIIQPVLQYGYSAAGGGPYWTIASWYVTLGSDVVYSPLVTVQSGNTIFGNMTKVDSDGWFINTVETETSKNSTITIHRSILSSQPWTYVTLEIYQVDDCEQMPPLGSKLEFVDLVLKVNEQTQTPQWSVGTDGQDPPVCKSSIEIVSPSAVTITF